MNAFQHGLRFMLLGGLLFVAYQTVELLSGSPTQEIVLTDAQLSSLRSTAARRLGRSPTESEFDAVVQQHADQEMLVMEALTQGMDRGDLLIRRRLLQNMRFIDRNHDAEVSEESLLEQAYRLGMLSQDPLVRQRLIFLVQAELSRRPLQDISQQDEDALVTTYTNTLEAPARIHFQQIFASGDDAEAKLRKVAGQNPSPQSVVQLSMPFFLALNIGPATQQEIAHNFGDSFADAVMALPVSQWSQPIRSAYGYHLIWVEQRWLPAAVDSQSVRERVRVALDAAHEQRALSAGMQELRARYNIHLGGREGV